MTRTTRLGVYVALFGALTVALVSSSACEEPPQPTATKPSATPAALPSATPSAEPEKKAKKKPRKKAEDCPQGNVVKFDDPKVEEAVRLKLQKPQGDITKAELGTVSSLNISQMEVNELDICLFPHMKSLKELFLGRGELDDLSPIAELTKLESLRASMNRVRDLTPLAKMTKMDRLDLGLTQASDLGPLAELTELTELQLDDTPVEDVSPLAKLTKLERLSLQRTRVKNYSPLKDLKALKFLYVKGSPGEFDAMGQLGSLTQGGLKIIAQ
jgi:internalin A